MERGTKELVLANRQFVWGLVARGFAEEPDAAFAAVLASEHARIEVGLVEDDATADMLAVYARLAAALQAGGLSAVRDDFTRIFVGPHTLEAAPWETMHTTGKRTLFHRDVLSVREAYRQAGFLPARYRQVPDDAIGLECDFMAKLSDDALAAFTEGDEARCQERLLQSLTFLTDHLLRWIDSLAAAVETNYSGTFYGELARFTALWCSRDITLVEACLATG